MPLELQFRQGHISPPTTEVPNSLSLWLAMMQHFCRKLKNKDENYQLIKLFLRKFIRLENQNQSINRGEHSSDSSRAWTDRWPNIVNFSRS